MDFVGIPHKRFCRIEAPDGALEKMFHDEMFLEKTKHLNPILRYHTAYDRIKDSIIPKANTKN